MVPREHWVELGKADLSKICSFSGAVLKDSTTLEVQFLNERLSIDAAGGGIGCRGCRRIERPLLELVTLLYLLKEAGDPVHGEMIGVGQLRNAHFFQGPHALDFSRLEDRYGNDPDAFKAAAKRLGGTLLEFADASCRLLPFPKVPLYFLLWTGDAEFKPRMSVLFDRTIERHFSADGIWGLVRLVSEALLSGKAVPAGSREDLRE
jgi:hypothetical protein